MKIQKQAGKILYRLSETSLGMRLSLWCLNHLRFVLPIHPIIETSHLIALQNPRPSYPVHILIVPKRTIKRFIDLAPSDADLLMEIVQAVQSLVDDLQLQQQGFRLIVNGGKYQTAPQLHFHLVSGEPARSDTAN